MYRFTGSLPYLLNRVGVRMGELFSRELAEHGLTLSMYRVLACLSERGDQRLSELSAMTTVEMTTLSRLVSAMHRRGLVSRRRPDDNLRTVQIALTTVGRDLAAIMMPRAAHYETVAMQGLTPGAVAALKTTLAMVFDNLGELEPQDTIAATAVRPADRDVVQV